METNKKIEAAVTLIRSHVKENKDSSLLMVLDDGQMTYTSLSGKTIEITANLMQWMDEDDSFKTMVEMALYALRKRDEDKSKEEMRANQKN